MLEREKKQANQDDSFVTDSEERLESVSSDVSNLETIEAQVVYDVT